ncbi:MAG TPA: erythromycin esterase family protein [Bacteroidales bacterium]|nr:erythromycin esterase family protein [Bacteroidales bacterium]HPR11758.1 erythromycin esterase family protein [Bacteroidales bacterium]HRW84094.1 erythromycin esterase family protein [Bacteroidales bacterium]
MKRSFSVLIIFILCFEPGVFACTAFCLKSNGNIYLSKNLDWPIDWGYLFLNERGIDKSVLTSSVISPEEFHWISKYRSITFNQFGKEFPLGGMNEKGLVIEELNMQSVKDKNDSRKTPINEFQFVQYILDNFESVGEITEYLDQFQYQPLFGYLHYIIADRSGDILIIEYNGSDFSLFHPNLTGFTVLSNNKYEESVKYCSNFSEFGGHMTIKNRKGSNERFVFTAKLIADFKNNSPVEYSFMILDSIKQNDTRWSLVYDINNLIVKVKFHSCTSIKEFNFNKILDLQEISSYGGNLSDCSLINNDGLSKVMSNDNTELVRNALLGLSEIDRESIDYNLIYKIADIGNRGLSCRTDENLVKELEDVIHYMPEASPMTYQDDLLADFLNREKFKVVGLGEATHGTKEFCELKHRLFRFLVENYDYRVLAYEFSYRKSLHINDFVLHGRGNIDSLLADESWIQNNSEVKNLLQWMRHFNQDKASEDKVIFIGIDNQLDALSPEETIRCLAGRYPEFVDNNSKLINQISQLKGISYHSMSLKEYVFRKELYQKLENMLLGDINLNRKSLSDYTCFNVSQLAKALNNSHEFLYRLYHDNENLRDRQLAENVLRINEWLIKDNGLVVWAHNAHIACNPDYYGNGKPAMGEYLKNALGNKYLSVATSFSKGRFKAVMLDDHGRDTKPLTCTIDIDPPCVSVNKIMDMAGSSDFLLKINDIDPDSELFSYLNTKMPFMGIGDLYLGSPEKHFFNDRIINLIDSYDLMFYFRDTAPVTISSN